MMITTENAKQYLPLVRDMADGVVLERCASGEWITTHVIDTRFDLACYRRKPVPRVVRVWVNQNTGEVGDKYTGPLGPCSDVLAQREGWYVAEFHEVL